MSRRMSCSLTIDAVRNRTKTVTRRHVDTWKDLKPGDRLTLIEKGMGLPKGAKHVVLAEVDVIFVDTIWLSPINSTELAAEGFPHMTANEFISMWLNSHSYQRWQNPNHVMVRRIEWRYFG